MKQKIKGYKLDDNKYLGAVKALTEPSYWGSETRSELFRKEGIDFYESSSPHSIGEKLRRAKVLSLWFAPVYEESSSTHLMVDIETMGNRPTSAIIEIGAITFNSHTAEILETFYTGVNLQSCLNKGLTVDASTISWWVQQDTQCKTLCKAPSPIDEALKSFAKFCSQDHIIWANSTSFDLSILKNAYNVVDLPVPWSYKNERCVRTISSLHPQIKDNWNWKGTAHNPIDDCHNQIGYLCETLKHLNLKV